MKNYAKKSKAAGAWTWPALFAVRDGKAGLPGGGKIAILELGGGWTQATLDAFADSLDMPHFTPTDVSVDGTTVNSHDETQDASAEVLLDIQAAAASYFLATGKVPDITILWGSDLTAIVAYFVQHAFDVLSISWGEDEKNWGQTRRVRFEHSNQSSGEQRPDNPRGGRR